MNFNTFFHAPTSKSRASGQQIKAIMQSDTWPVWLILSGVDDMMGVIGLTLISKHRGRRVVEMELLLEHEIPFVASVFE